MTFNRHSVLACAALAVTLLTTACAAEEDSAGPRPVETSAEPRPVETYGPGRTRVEVAAGESFTIALKENRTTPFLWAILEPGPDPVVVTLTDDRYEGDNTDLVGAGGTHYYTFRAESAGQTRFALRHCSGCGTKYEETDGPDDIEEVTFDITVRE
ncbi:protease inhibitor I42 family protein [Streptomyces sp. JJ38]|uniref:protease inhibitor I42 family protein n=1 Tax=Streptomyces sp. JJ38 TaxID=2738128 RepID=UPI001C5826B0|nr:protease inhibitor I42 family protein [Streptomyces sp. JJ38]MBW1598346.1 protease inhibitor I42 family protein [Streptomyces sp. JJ38]